jgi:outer membrane biosynthesis protein TonB
MRPVDGATRLRSASFTDRVMARVANEPTPSPGRVFARSLRRLALRDALAALASAWRLAFEPASPVTASARASAAALFLSVVIVVGVGGAFVTSGALAMLGPDVTAPQELGPAAAPTESPVAVIEPTPMPSLAPTPSPTPTATPTPTPRATPRATEPDERAGEKREKRETPEPKERDERDDDERDDDEREEDD